MKWHIGLLAWWLVLSGSVALADVSEHAAFLQKIRTAIRENYAPLTSFRVTTKHTILDPSAKKAAKKEGPNHQGFSIISQRPPRLEREIHVQVDGEKRRYTWKDPQMDVVLVVAPPAIYLVNHKIRTVTFDSVDGHRRDLLTFADPREYGSMGESFSLSNILAPANVVFTMTGKDASGKMLHVVEAKNRGLVVRVEFDPEKSLLPVRFQYRPVEWQRFATEYKIEYQSVEVAGKPVWFFARGNATFQTGDAVNHSPPRTETVIAEDLEVNPRIPPEIFETPTLPRGYVLRDHLKQVGNSLP